VVEILSLLVVGPLVLVAFIGLSHATMNSTPVQEVAKMPFLDRLPDAAIAISPYVMVTVFFMGMYMFVPNTRVQWRPALIGALAGGFLWAAVGKMFTAFVVHATRLTIVYAGFAIIVVALLWTYLGWLILLAGAQLSFYVQNPTYLRVGTQELRLSCVELEQLALKMMYLVGQMHLTGGKRWTINRMSRQLQLPGIAVAKMARALERGGLVKISDDSELLCARETGRIAINDILEMARNLRSGHMPPQDASVPPVDRLLAQLDARRREHCSDLTLRDLLDDTPPAPSGDGSDTFTRRKLPR
jgi:membrane protein